MMFIKQKNYGPKISLTERQIGKLKKQLLTVGLTCSVENCRTGSVYIDIGYPTKEKDINGKTYIDFGWGNDVAQLRLSGHDSGRVDNATHSCVGIKGECLQALDTWVAAIVADRLEALAVCYCNRRFTFIESGC